jgi:hypothetical protein
MDFSSLKKIQPLYFYFGSIVCFIVANLIRDISITLYYVLILIGLVFFVLGFLRRLKTK